eukprot:262304_1
MIYLLYISWLFITQAANDCYYGWFELDGLSECVFNCNGRDVKYIDKAEVTFDQIVHSCGNVQNGYKLEYCSKLDDLVWGDDCQYSCPYCKCTDKDAGGSPESFEGLGVKACYNCTCDAHKDDTTYEGYLLECDRTESTYSPYQWKDFQCPTKYCSTNDNGGEAEINENWWADVVADAKCEKFCYCDTDAIPACVTGWSNILDSENEGVVDAFNRECRDRLTACLDEPDRLFTTDVGPNCYDCPKCDCGIHAVDDKWWVEYEDEDEPGSTQCVQCRCYATGDTANPSYASCGMEDVSYAKGTGDCPPTNTFKCHSEGGSYIDAEPTAPIVVGTTLNEEVCYESVETPSNFCSWSVSHEVEKRDGAVDSNEWSYSWGSCDDSMMCAIFGGNDECFYSDYTYSYTNCDGEVKSGENREYIYCCNSDNCNHKDIDITTCIEKKAYGEVFAEMYKCIYEDYDDQCSKEINIVHMKEEKTTCANVRAEFKDSMECDCKITSDMYKEASSEYKKLWDKQQPAMTASGRLSEWNEALGCNTNLLCNIKTGSVYDKADNKIYFVAAMFTAIVVMIIY